MTPQEARKLLGGYATGTLTPAEEQALFAAALADQELFDELAREQGLRETLADPSARARLLSALDEGPLRWWQSWRIWTAVAAMAGVGVVAVSLRKPPAAPVEIARVEAPTPAPAAPAPEAPPVPPPKERRPTVRQKAASPAPKAEVAPESTTLSNAAADTAAETRMAAPQRFQPMLARSGAVQPLGIRYSIVREGDSVAVRFTSTVNGYLSVAGATPIALIAMQPYTTPALAGDEVRAVFARVPRTDADASVTAESSGGDNYVVAASGDAVAFTIPLKRP